MGFFKDIRKNQSIRRLSEEMLYEQVAREIQRGERRDGLWAKAMAECNMREDTARARYIALRVASLKDELSLLTTIQQGVAQPANDRLIENNPAPQNEPKIVKNTEADERFFRFLTAILVAVVFWFMIIPLTSHLYGDILSDRTIKKIALFASLVVFVLVASKKGFSVFLISSAALLFTAFIAMALYKLYGFANYLLE